MSMVNGLGSQISFSLIVEAGRGWFRAGFAQVSRRFRAGFAGFRGVSPICYHMVSRGFARFFEVCGCF